MNAFNLVVYYRISSFGISFHESFQITIPLGVCFDPDSEGCLILRMVPLCA